MQRKRWARGQGEVLHVHLGEVSRWRNHRMWLVGIEGLASLVWVVALATSLVLALLGLLLSDGGGLFGFALAWGFGIALVGTVQVIFALTLEHGYDRSIFRPLLVGALYPVAFWLVSGVAALRSEVAALLRGPTDRRVVWNIPREPLAEKPEASRRDG